MKIENIESDANSIICPICDGRGFIFNKECNNPDCIDGILKDYEDIIEEIDKR